MIFDTTPHIEQYKNVHQRVYKALTVLRNTDFSALEDGRHEVDGDDIYFMLQSYDTRTESKVAEAHKNYIDIQMILDGREKMGIAPLESMEREVEANPDSDFWLYEGDMQYIKLTPSAFVVLFPEDAHAPGLAVDESEHVRKCVFKVRL